MFQSLQERQQNDCAWWRLIIQMESLQEPEQRKNCLKDVITFYPKNGIMVDSSTDFEIRV